LDPATPNKLRVGDFFAGAFAVEDSSDAAFPPTPSKLMLGDFVAGAFAAEDFSNAALESGDAPMPKSEIVGDRDRVVGDGFDTAAFFFVNGFFATDFLFDAALTTFDFGAPPTPIIESVGDLDEGAVGDGFFVLVEGTLGELKNILRVGERFGVVDLGGVGDSFFTLVGDTLGALEKILRVGERFGV